VKRIVVLLQVQGLYVSFETLRGKIRAVDGVDFNLDHGQILGLSGESGCGKTTTALSILKLLPPNATIEDGSILFDGDDLRTIGAERMRELRWKKISIIFQGAMNALDPVRNVESQIVEAIKVHEAKSKTAASSRARELLNLVELDPDRGKSYPHELSGGMKQRVMIAMALACNPELVIADEPTTALDVMIQASILKLLAKLQKDLSLSLIVISHDLSVLAQICDRIAIMYAGRIVEDSRTEDLTTHPAHPYSVELLRAIPPLQGEKSQLESIPGTPPDLLNPPIACRFSDRCRWRQQDCTVRDPQLREIAQRHAVACHYPR
jgi:peptide/nickel transport system ATP-binding protein